MGRALTTEFRLLFFAILGVIVPFGLLLYFFPNGTNVYWAWPIAEPRSAMLIGGAYLGATVYYVLALKRNEWEQVENGLGGLIVFSLVLLAATMVHWDAFKPYHPITLVWLAFYYAGPFLVPIFYHQQVEAMDPATEKGIAIAPAVRVWLIGRGVFYALIALLGFILADTLVGVWPWPIQPLELRVFVGQIAVVSWGGLVAFWSSRAWHLHRLGILLAGSIGAVQLVGLLIGSTPYQLSAGLGTLLPILFAEWLASAVVLTAMYERG